MKSEFFFFLEKNRHGRAFFIIFMSVLTVWPTVATTQEARYFIANQHKVDISSFDRKLNKMIDEVGVPGISVAIISNNKVVYSNGYGYKQASTKDKVNSETIFEACSVSKTYLAFVALKLVDEGKLDLDKPMYQYMEYKPLAHDPRYKLITPRMALCHTTGIENWIWDNNPDTLELLYNPSERYSYSGEGYQYLALVIQSILHKPYEQYIREMILAPLNLKRTFTFYSKDGSFPVNYAIGHSVLKKEVPKWKNFEPLPAAGVNVSAYDYAEFLISVFDKHNLSSMQRKNILSPYVLLDKQSPDIYRGTAFEVLYEPKDTIISHSGNNMGFKAFVAYSVVSRSGFVLFANGDLGVQMANYICNLSVGLDIAPFFRTDIIPQYSSPAFSLLKIYREKNSDSMFAEIERRQNVDKHLAHTLNGLSELLYTVDKVVAKKLLDNNISQHPNDPEAYYLLGETYMGQKQYQSAYQYFVKSKEMGFNIIDCDEYIRKCRTIMK